MKLKELFGRETIAKDYWGHPFSVFEFSINGRAKVDKIIKQYFNEECVVCYLKDKFGLAFIMRSKNKFFAFLSLKTVLPDIGGYNYKIVDMKLKEAKKLMGEDVIIVDADLYGKLNKYLIVSTL